MISATELRQKLYTVLDEILATGIPVEVSRFGKVLRIVPAEGGKLSRLEAHDIGCADPEALVHLDWSKEWHPE
ncbi:MAG: type II toxin-antitoxin system Phd/YefM family antitoxin [Spirochaetales bacterium]|nr:type II toxin-antitoxin system Phd/YefM family antitoxin [Spirochaetales bacterium]